MSTSTFLQIKELLDKNNVVYEHFVHAHVTTSQDAAAIRNTNLDDAAKAIICKVENRDGSFDFIQAVIQASKRIDLKKLKRFLDSKNVALASPDEVLEKTGCTIGSVPPFAILFGIKMYVDEDLLKRESIVFSAGTHTDSIQMKPHDYINIVNPVVMEFKKK
jgi:Ala-tRNA(Pro) deacylase